MKKISLLIIIGLLVIFAFVSGGAYFWWKDATSPVDENAKTQRFVITKGSSASTIGTQLEDAGIIKNALAFKIYTQVFDKTKSINAGEFNLSPSMNLSEIIEALGKGPAELWVTVPEGLRREEIVWRFVDGLGKQDEEKDQFIKDFMYYTEDLEGYLFPDTYLFPREVSAQKVVEKMRLTFDSKYKDIKNTSGQSSKDVVIMASLIEKETKTDEERPVVSGILWKRLRSDWLLQVDACSQYELGSNICSVSTQNCDWWPELTRADLEKENKYNTYKNFGLPPTPIANPGLSSLRAAANPVESDYWYYIHSDDGVIHYGADLDQHNRNIQVYLGK